MVVLVVLHLNNNLFKDLVLAIVLLDLVPYPYATYVTHYKHLANSNLPSLGTLYDSNSHAIRMHQNKTFGTCDVN